MSSAISFEGKVAIITGAGRGLGHAYANELAGRGAAVVINDIGGGDQSAEHAAEAIRSRGGRAVASNSSIALPGTGRELVELATSEFGGVHAVIHNAGMSMSGALADISDEDIELAYGVHVRGAFELLRSAWPVMREQGYGRVLLTSSGAGAFGREYGAVYCSVKAALIGLMRSLALEGAEYGVLVNAIMPYAQTGILNDNPIHGAGDDARRITSAISDLYSADAVPSSAVAPLAAYLCSNRCGISGASFSAGAGHFAEVFTGLTIGWSAGAAQDTASAEEIDANLHLIRDRAGYLMPSSVADEMERLAVLSGAR
jgi:NAD(P)-dependent dehydrogenase (short-subunit alcohol dehydrogenase family)